MAQLTFHACNDLRNQNNDPDILISTPVVHVVGFRELPTLRTLSDVEIKFEMTVADGSEDTMDLVLRADFSIGGFAYDGSPLEGSTIKLQHMIRIPSGTNQRSEVSIFIVIHETHYPTVTSWSRTSRS